jgi:hypothetical protein
MEFLLLGVFLGVFIVFGLPALVDRLSESEEVCDLVSWWEF